MIKRLFLLSLLLIGVVTILFFAVPKKTLADSTKNLTGFAWSDITGWISFNNSSTGDSISYGVDYSTSTGYLTGYAWSSSLGWIEFGGLSGFPTGSGTTADNAKINSVTGSMTGWARVLSYDSNWDGWISLSGTTLSGTPYGVNYSLVNGNTTGWAWGSDNLGWISFNRSNQGDSVTYTVSGPKQVANPLAPVITTTSPVSSVCVNNNPSVSISFNSVVGASSYRLYRCDSSESNCFPIGTPTPSVANDTPPNISATYYYHLTSVDSSNNESTSPSSIKSTVSVCPTNPITLSPTKSFITNPTTINSTGGKCNFIINLVATPDSNSQCQITDVSTNNSFLFVPNSSTYSVINSFGSITKETQYKLVCWENDPITKVKISGTETLPKYSTCYVNPNYKETN